MNENNVDHGRANRLIDDFAESLKQVANEHETDDYND